MKISVIAHAIMIAFGFATWPIIAKYSRVQGAWVGTVIAAGTFAMVALFSSKQLAATGIPPARAIILLLAASAINGFGVYLYSQKAADPAVPTGIFVVMVAVSIAVMAPFMDIIVNKAKLSAHQMIGLVLAAGAIYLLRR